MLPDRNVADPAAVSRLLSAVGWRRWLEQCAWAIAIGAIAAALLVVIAHVTGPGAQTSFARIGTTFVVAVIAGWSTRRWRNPAAAARTIERAHPVCRNLVITVEELQRHPGRATQLVTARVMADASQVTSDLRAGQIVPAWRALAAVGAALAVSFLPAPAGRNALSRALDIVLPGRAPGADAAVAFRVDIDPPAYSGRKSVSISAPERIVALEGSRIRFEVPDGWRVRFGTAEPSRQIVAQESGYFAIEAAAEDGRRILVPMSVVPDRAPAVRIETPAKDLLLPDGTRRIPVKLSASDDLGLERLELRYTKVSGSGEQFEFIEGTVPVTLERASERDWTAAAQLELALLKLGPGDSLVYRAVARDARPGDAGLATSDTYFVEIAGPGQVPLEGVEMPPELERYAMSQQMIVVKIERLRARESKMAPEALTEEAASLAAEQRTVRANFVFLLGGHVEDEVEEAEQSHEIQEGRLENTARKDVNAAISQMTRAEQGLTARNTSAALPPARAAVESLQRAFGRSRYLLRSLAVRSRVDPSRRLAGDLEGAGEWRRSSGDPGGREGDDVRRLLSDLIDTSASAANSSGPDLAPIRRLAESALAIDPASPLWQDIARRLLAAKDTAALRQVITHVSPEAVHGLIGRTPLSREASSLERAFMSEKRR